MRNLLFGYLGGSGDSILLQSPIVACQGTSLARPKDLEEFAQGICFRKVELSWKSNVKLFFSATSRA
jgi:hypothetical protein